MSLFGWVAEGFWLVNITRTSDTGPVEATVVPVTLTPPARMKAVLVLLILLAVRP